MRNLTAFNKRQTTKTILHEVCRAHTLNSRSILTAAPYKELVPEYTQIVQYLFPCAEMNAIVRMPRVSEV